MADSYTENMARFARISEEVAKMREAQKAHAARQVENRLAAFAPVRHAWDDLRAGDVRIAVYSNDAEGFVGEGLSAAYPTSASFKFPDEDGETQTITYGANEQGHLWRNDKGSGYKFARDADELINWMYHDIAEHQFVAAQ